MKHEILLVDAERRSVRLLEVALRSAGYSVRIAGNGVDALEKIEAAAPDLLVTDSQLPKLDGYSLVQKLRGRAETAHIPSIVLTGPSEDWARWQALGVVERLLKPVFVRELVACVGLLIARSARARITGETSASRFGTRSGSTEDLAVVDLLQAFEMLRESGVLRLLRRAQQAEIHFRDGRAVDASIGRLRGERAVYAVLGWNDASFEVEFRPVNLADVIDRSTATLLMEGMRRLDETTSSLEQGRVTPIPEVDHVRLLEEVGLQSPGSRPAPAFHDEKPSSARSAGSETRVPVEAISGPPSDARSTPGRDDAPPLARGPEATREAPTGASEPRATREISTDASERGATRPVPSGTLELGSLREAPARDEHSTSAQGGSERSFFAGGGSATRLADDFALPGEGGVRLPSPSARPWTREVDPSSEFPFDDDVAEAGLPRTVSRTAKRVVAATVTVATLICITAGLRTMSIRRERLAEAARRPIASPSLTLAGPAPSPVPRAVEVEQTAAAAGTAGGAPEEGKSLPAEALPASVEAGGVAAAENSAAAGRERVDPVEAPTAERPAGQTPAEPRVLPAAPPAAARESGAVANGSGAAAGGPARASSVSALVKEAEQALLDGANERALALANEAVAASPADAAGWLVLGSVHRAMGEDEAARLDYRRCVAQALTAGVNDCRILAER